MTLPSFYTSSPFMKLGIVGATGLVGQHFLKLLEEDPGFEIEELRGFARSKKEFSFQGKTHQTKTLGKNCFEGLDLCFFSAGGEVSKSFAPQAVEEGVIVVDNSSAFRKDKDKLLIVPEVNGDLLNFSPQIISNPNCSTIQLVMALKALDKTYGLLPLSKSQAFNPSQELEDRP